MSHKHLKTPNNSTFFILPVKFHYTLTVSHKMYMLKQKIVIEREVSVRHKEANEKHEKKTRRFLMFLRKMKMKKLRRSYQINMNYFLYPKDYDSSIDTFSFNMHIFGQYTHFHLIGIFSVNRYIFIQ